MNGQSECGSMRWKLCERDESWHAGARWKQTQRCRFSKVVSESDAHISITQIQSTDVGMNEDRATVWESVGMWLSIGPKQVGSVSVGLVNLSIGAA